MAFSESDPSELSLNLGLALGNGACRRLPGPGWWTEREEVGESSAGAAEARRRNAAAPYMPYPRAGRYPDARNQQHNYNYHVQYLPVVAAVPQWAPPPPPPPAQQQQPEQEEQLGARLPVAHPVVGAPQAAAAGAVSGSFASDVSEDDMEITPEEAMQPKRQLVVAPSAAVRAPVWAAQPLAQRRPFPYNVRWGRPVGARVPRMPCVAFTGDGPNGRRVVGYLRRASKTEIAIICACHNAVFSPVGFMQHGGAADLSEPLKRITVLGN